MKGNYATTIDRLMTLRHVLSQCKYESVIYAEEWEFYEHLTDEVDELLTEAKRMAGYMVVYPIINGCSGDSLYEGTPDQCNIFIDTLFEGHPDMRGNIITIPL